MERSKKMQTDVEVVTGEVIISDTIKNNDIIDSNSLELIVLNVSTPVISTNYEELKKGIKDILTEYKDIVITEESLKDSKKKQKELASLRIKLEDNRKKYKKEMEEPIKTFEGQMKELVALVEETEIPIKEAIAVFDQKKKDENIAFCKEYFDSETKDLNISNKFLSEYTVPNEALNLSSTKKALKTAVMNQIQMMQNKQNEENEKIQLIQSTIEKENETIGKKLEFDSFRFIIDSGASLADILEDIRSRANDIREAETAAKTIVSSSDVSVYSEVLSSESEEFSSYDSSYNDIPTNEPETMTPAGLFVEIPTEIPSQAIVVPPTLVNPEKESSEPNFEVTFKITGSFSSLKGLSDLVNDYIARHGDLSKTILEQKQI